MNYQFCLPLGYATADLVNLNRVYVKMGPIRRWLRPLLRWAMTLCGAALLVVGAVMLVGGAEDGLIISTIIFLVVGLLWLLVGLFANRVNAWSSRRLMMKGLGNITVILDESGVTETSDKGTALHPFSAFVDVVYYRNTYFLFFDKRHAIILPTRAMTQGSPATFADWWSQHSGKEICSFSR